MLIRCDNQTVVPELQTSRARDPYLCACSCNICYVTTLNNIDLQYVHVPGKHSKFAVLFSCWSG